MVNPERFWKKVAVAKKTECWLWLGAKKPKGYGNVRINKKYLSSHRVAWEMTFGAIPTGMQVQHSCDNPSCCNPSHLMLGTVVSNFIDMVKKGRCRSNHKNRKVGEDNHLSKLTTQQVDSVKKRYVRGLVRQKDLAAEYGVTQPAISAIILGKVRTHG
jgi:hypothetical protein